MKIKFIFTKNQVALDRKQDQAAWLMHREINAKAKSKCTDTNFYTVRSRIS